MSNAYKVSTWGVCVGHSGNDKVRSEEECIQCSWDKYSTHAFSAYHIYTCKCIFSDKHLSCCCNKHVLFLHCFFIWCSGIHPSTATCIIAIYVLEQHSYMYHFHLCPWTTNINQQSKQCRKDGMCSSGKACAAKHFPLWLPLTTTATTVLWFSLLPWLLSCFMKVIHTV